MDFNKTYRNSPDSLKMKYLDAIIQNNDQLKNEFLAFVASHENQVSKPSYEAFAATIVEVQKAYQSHFESVDLENPDWESYSPPDTSYIEEWEQYQQASEQEFQEYFQKFLSDALDTIIAQKPEALLAMLVGLLEAADSADVPDEVGSFEDVNAFLLMEHSKLTNELAQKLRLAALADNKIRISFELFFQYCKKEYPDHPHFPHPFEPVLLALAEKSENPDQLIEICKQASVKQEVVPELTLLLYKSSGNQKAWLRAAQQMFLNSAAVAKELLQYYFENDQSAFLETANTLFSYKPNSWASFLASYISPELDKHLFAKVFTALTIAEKDIVHYRKVKPFLDEKAYQHILQAVHWDKVFLAKIFTEDKNYANIKALVEKDSDRWNFDKLITPILQIYPAFCFAKIKTMVEITLANERGRNIYVRIAKWLTLSKQIPGHEADAMYLIKTTYNHKPNLPALKDEMRKAGLG